MSNNYEGPVDLLIGRKWQHSSDGRRMDVVNAADRSTLASVAAGTTSDAVAAVAAVEAADGWAPAPPRERVEIPTQAFELMMSRREELATFIVLENCKALPDALGDRMEQSGIGREDDHDGLLTFLETKYIAVDW